MVLNFDIVGLAMGTKRTIFLNFKGHKIEIDVMLSRLSTLTDSYILQTKQARMCEDENIPVINQAICIVSRGNYSLSASLLYKYNKLTNECNRNVA